MGSPSGLVSPKIRYESSEATKGTLSRSSASGAPALSIALRATMTGTSRKSTTATAATARRVVELATAIETDA